MRTTRPEERTLSFTVSPAAHGIRAGVTGRGDINTQQRSQPSAADAGSPKDRPAPQQARRQGQDPGGKQAAYEQRSMVQRKQLIGSDRDPNCT